MSIFTALLILCIFGFLLWLANTYIPMQPIVKNIFNFIAVIILIVWLLQLFGLMSGFGNLHG